jgi:DNA-binding transcriptional ArsR family regulator
VNKLKIGGNYLEEKIPKCHCKIIHEDVVDKVKSQLIKESLSTDLADFFKVFSDGTRLKILSALFHSELCVCDLAATLDMSHSAVSHQLRIFKAARLVKYRKEGKNVYYSLADSHIAQIFNQGLEHIQE